MQIRNYSKPQEYALGFAFPVATIFAAILIGTDITPHYAQIIEKISTMQISSFTMDDIALTGFTIFWTYLITSATITSTKNMIVSYSLSKQNPISLEITNKEEILHDIAEKVMIRYGDKEYPTGKNLSYVKRKLKKNPNATIHAYITKDTIYILD